MFEIEPFLSRRRHKTAPRAPRVNHEDCRADELEATRSLIESLNDALEHAGVLLVSDCGVVDQRDLDTLAELKLRAELARHRRER